MIRKQLMRCLLLLILTASLLHTDNKKNTYFILAATQHYRQIIFFIYYLFEPQFGWTWNWRALVLITVTHTSCCIGGVPSCDFNSMTLLLGILRKQFEQCSGSSVCIPSNSQDNQQDAHLIYWSIMALQFYGIRFRSYLLLPLYRFTNVRQSCNNWQQCAVWVREQPGRLTFVGNLCMDGYTQRSVSLLHCVCCDHRCIYVWVNLCIWTRKEWTWPTRKKLVGVVFSAKWDVFK